METKIEEILKDVYDPEFPMVDVWHLGLIYNISIDKKKQYIYILMTVTTPACPMPELIMELVKNAIIGKFPKWETEVELTFDPMWSPELIKDEDIKQMFVGE